MVRRSCASRQYNVYVAPDGVVYRSASSAWDSLPPLLPATQVSPGATSPPLVGISPLLSGLLEAFSIPLSCLPDGVLSCVDAAFHPDCPPYLVAVAQAHVALIGPDHFLAAPSPPVEDVPPGPAEQPAVSDEPSLRLREVSLLRALLPPGV